MAVSRSGARVTSLSPRDVLLQDLWLHLAGLIAIGLGASDLWYFHAFSHDTDLLLMAGGFAGMGLKIVNGSAAALRTAALDTAFSAARAAGTAAESAQIVAKIAPTVAVAAPPPAVAPAPPDPTGAPPA